MNSGKNNLIDHLFLWQPAVADNAWWRYAIPRHLRAASKAWDLAASDDPMDDILGKLRGAYDKKWWIFPSFLDNGFGPAIEKLYKDYLPLRILDHPDRPSASYVTTREGADRLDAALSRIKTEIQENWARLERDIFTEANALWQPCIDCLRNGERPPDYTLLAPLNHNASVSPQMAKDYVLRLKKLAANNWVPEQSPRPALGYVGLNELLDERTADFDEFINRLVTDQVIGQTDQSTWLFSHSGMRIPTQELFDEVYQREIMNERLLANSKFGRY